MKSRSFFIRLGLLAAWLMMAATAHADDTVPPTAPSAAELTGTTQTLYLPLVMKQFGGGLVNVGFESGNTGWTVYSSNARTVIRTSFVGSVTPHTGSWAAWLGGADDELTTLGQLNLSVSSSAPYLTYWRWIASADYCGYDYGYVTVNLTNVETFDLCDDYDTDGWVKQVLDLSAFAGQAVSLTFQADLDDSLNSNLFIDDVAFQSTP